MREYLLSSTFENELFRTNPERIQRLKEWKLAFQDSIFEGNDEGCNKYYTDLVNLCNERIKYYENK